MNDTTAKKLLKALKLFIPSSAALALKEDDAQRFFDIANMNGLTIIHGESEVKVKYESVNTIYDSVMNLCEKHIPDFRSKYSQMFEVKVDDYSGVILNVRFWSKDSLFRKTDGYLFEYTGSVSLKAVMLLLEEKLKGIKTEVVVEAPVEDVEPKND